MKYINILVFLLSISMTGQERKIVADQLPQANDLIGYWKMVEIPNADQKNKVNPWPQKHQWFAFYESGKMYSMMSDADEKLSKGSA